MESRATISMKRMHAIQRIGQYGFAVCVSVLAFFWLYELWGISLRFPIVPLGDDAIVIQALFKGAVDNPGIYHNAFLGAPFGQDLRDLPMPDVAIWGAVKLCSWFTNNHILVRNLVVIGSFPLMTVTSLYAMRRLGIGYLVALGTSLLFSFSSFHHWRSIAHVFMALGYFTIPLVTLLAIDLNEDRPLFFEAGERWYRPKWVNSRLTWVTVAWCAVVGMTGSVYFPFYAVFLLAIASIFAATRNRSLLVLARGGFALATIVGSLVLSLAPNLWSNWLHGTAPVIARYPADTERFGFKLAQLVLPVSGHKLSYLKALGEYYNINGLLGNENQTSYLGLVGAVGFVILLAWGLRGRQNGERLHLLSVMTVAAVLFGTIGGLASLFSFLVNPTIRSNNRISVYVGYFALLAIAVLAERLRATFATTRWRQVSLAALLVGITTFGLYEQHAVSNDYAALKASYLKDKAFVAAIEDSVPRGSSIFQYPYFPFPEAGWQFGLSDYGLFIPYLHSESLKWSFGAIKGRRGDAWYEWVGSMPAKKAVETLVYAGFAGVYVARNGYQDGGKALEDSLRAVLGEPDVVDSLGRTAFYSLEVVARELRATLSRSTFRHRQQEALSPLFFGWLDGFYPREGNKTCGRKSAKFVLSNPGPESKMANLKAKMIVAHPVATVRISGALLNREFRVGQDGYLLDEKLEIPPGEHFHRVETLDPPNAPYDFDRHERICFVSIKLTRHEGTSETP